MFSQEIADRILQGLAEGKSLRAVCREEGMPVPSTVLEWTEEQPAFGEQYMRTRARAYQLLAEEIVEISDDGTGDSWIDDEGQVRTNNDVIARSKLRVDTRKWMLSKMLPKVYGDKLDVTMEINDRAGQMRKKREERFKKVSASGTSE